MTEHGKFVVELVKSAKTLDDLRGLRARMRVDAQRHKDDWDGETKEAVGVEWKRRWDELVKGGAK